MRALKVVARLESGRVATMDGWLPLDGILAWAWMLEHNPDLLWHTDAGRRGDLVTPELPLERRELGGEWFWAASFAQYKQLAESIAYSHKRFDDTEAAGRVDFGGRRGKVHTQSGYYKNQRLPLVYIVTPRLVWYAVGDQGEVELLLAMIPGIGKKTATGYGAVAEWMVEPWPIDLSCVDERGRPMRALPGANGPDQGGIRPPYWHPVNQTRCWQPPPGGWPEDAQGIDWYDAVGAIGEVTRGNGA